MELESAIVSRAAQTVSRAPMNKFWAHVGYADPYFFGPTVTDADRGSGEGHFVVPVRACLESYLQSHDIAYQHHDRYPLFVAELHRIHMFELLMRPDVRWIQPLTLN